MKPFLVIIEVTAQKDIDRVTLKYISSHTFPSLVHLLFTICDYTEDTNRPVVHWLDSFAEKMWFATFVWGWLHIALADDWTALSRWAHTWLGPNTQLEESLWGAWGRGDPQYGQSGKQKNISLRILNISSESSIPLQWTKSKSYSFNPQFTWSSPGPSICPGLECITHYTCINLIIHTSLNIS